MVVALDYFFLVFAVQFRKKSLPLKSPEQEGLGGERKLKEEFETSKSAAAAQISRFPFTIWYKHRFVEISGESENNK